MTCTVDTLTKMLSIEVEDGLMRTKTSTTKIVVENFAQKYDVHK